MASLDALLLDVGGTLLTERPPRDSIYASIARAEGLEVSDADMRALMRSAHHALPRVLEGAYRYSDPWFEAFIGRIFRDRLGLREARLRAVTDELFERFQSPGTFRLFPGCRELLDACRERGIRLAVVSNWSARLPHVLRAVELADAFDVVVCSAIEACEKPEPAIFRLALERLGVAPDRVLHAGDHLTNDGYGAREAGIDVVLVDHRGKLAADEAAAAFPRVGGLLELRDRILCPEP